MALNGKLAKIEKCLLSDNLEQLEQGLELSLELTNGELKQLEHPFIFGWLVHEDESVRTKSEAILQKILSDEERQHLQQQFTIFKSISEYFPWMGDYTDLQKQNFETFKAVSEIYEATLVKSPKYIESFLDLARKLYMLFGLEEEAQFCFERVLVFDNNHDEAYYALGRIFEKQYQHKRALSHYERCVALNDKNTFGLLSLGVLKATVFDRPNESIRHYGRVIELDPYSAEAYIRTAEAYFDLEEHQSCKQFIDMALSINEFHEEALNLLGTMQWKVEGDYEKAIETYQKGLDHQVHDDSPLLMGSLGTLYVEYLQDYDKGRLHFEKSLKAKPNQADVVMKYINLLVMHYQDYGAAIDAYENYLKLEYRNIDMHINYAAFLMDYLHDYTTAQDAVDKALALDKENERAMKLKGQLQELLHPIVEDHNDGGLDYDGDDDDDDDDDEFVGGGAAGDS